MPDNVPLLPHRLPSLRQGLFNAQEMTPSLRDAYQKELEGILHETLTPRKRLMAIVLLLIIVAVVVGEVRALLVYPGGVTFYIGAVTMMIACAITSAWILRDWRKKQVARKSVLKVSDLFYCAASVLTVASLMHGLSAPSDPKSTFNAFYVFVFLVVCLGWSLYNHIYAAALANREQILRVECRLAELTEQMAKMGQRGS